MILHRSRAAASLLLMATLALLPLFIPGAPPAGGHAVAAVAAFPVLM